MALSLRFAERLAPYRAISALAALAVAIRLAYLRYMLGTPGFAWLDPDGYLFKAWSLIGDGGIWRWNTEAVRYAGPFLKAPLYPVLLSCLEYSPRGYRLSAGVLHAVLGGLAVFALGSLARDLYSNRAGLIAASLYAVYFRAVVSVNALMQERLYVPLLIVAFALLARAFKVDRPSLFAMAGVAFGAAALTRSMPVYFIPPAVAGLMFAAERWQTGLRRAGPLLAGFCALVLPYTLFISAEAGRFVLIENIGAYGVSRLDPDGQAYFPNAEFEAPGAADIAKYTLIRAAADPVAFLGQQVSEVQGNFKLGAGRWLDEYGSLPTAKAALLTKIAAHLFGDGLFMVMALAAPFGFIATRRNPLAQCLGLWIVVHLVMTSLAGYSGQRFREPIDWTLLALAAALMAGAGSNLSRREILAGAPVAVLIGWPMFSWAGTSLASRADYGIHAWESSEDARSTVADGGAGFKVIPANGVIDVSLKTTPGDPIAVWEFRVDGGAFHRAVVDAEGYRIRAPSRAHRVFLEIRPDAPGAPLTVEVRR